ncbi:SDR family NAD(P)-dependent oxidoreductase [Hydrotalea sp.]|uniref:SDR family NAD(P)-dependent oxidoreductase n=1 Tax=Hydrotalea sp. TaxID=2881279 RepID=UPI003D0C8563
MTTKTVLVTGAAGNLGKAVVQKFAIEAYSVYALVHSITQIDTWKDLPVTQLPTDLLNEHNCQTSINTVIAATKHIDVAVLTAGGFTMGTIADTDLNKMQQQMALNFETAYNIARPVFLQMLQQNNGHLFLTGSKAGLNTQHAKGVTAYGLSKSLLFRLAEIMQAEANGTQVHIHVIVPNIIDTPQNRAAMPNADFSKWTLPETIADKIYAIVNSNSIEPMVIMV